MGKLYEIVKEYLFWLESNVFSFNHSIGAFKEPKRHVVMFRHLSTSLSLFNSFLLGNRKVYYATLVMVRPRLKIRHSKGVSCLYFLFYWHCHIKASFQKEVTRWSINGNAVSCIYFFVPWKKAENGRQWSRVPQMLFRSQPTLNSLIKVPWLIKSTATPKIRFQAIVPLK